MYQIGDLVEDPTGGEARLFAAKGHMLHYLTTRGSEAKNLAERLQRDWPKGHTYISEIYPTHVAAVHRSSDGKTYSMQIKETS